MQIETLKDVIQWTRECHQHLSECLIHCANHSESERAKLLLEYLAKHESTLAKVVEGFERTGNENALATWCYEFLDKHPTKPHLHCDAPFSSLNTGQIIKVIMEQHKKITDLYDYLWSRIDSPSAKELLDSLMALEYQEVAIMSQGANRLEDL